MSNKILVTPKSFGTYRDKALELIHQAGYELVENTLGHTLSPDEIIQIAKDDVVGIIIGIDPLPAEVLTACKHLKAISKYGVGTDNIDLVKAAELGIKVDKAIGTNTISVAELAITLMMNTSRNILPAATSVRSGGWSRSIGREVTGKTLGLMGGGQIGKEVAKRAKGLMMNVTLYDPYFTDFAFTEQYGIRYTTDINDIYTQSDYISLHLPATEQTIKMINKDTLALMKPSAYIINTSRGELIDEQALFEALSTGVIAGCCEDVFSSEPPAPDEKLLTLDNFLLTPHVGAFTMESVEKMVLVSTQNLLDMLANS